MILILFPAFCALLIKAYVLYLCKYRTKSSVALCQLITFFALHNLVELITVASWMFGGTPLMLLKAYYATTVMGMTSIITYSATITENKKFIKCNYALIFISACFSVYILAASSVIEGVQSIGYSVTAVKGDNYLFFRLWVLVSIVYLFSILFYGLIKTDSKLVRERCKTTMLSLLPIVATGGGIVALMSMNFKVNASAVMPVATTLFIAIIIYTEFKHKLTSIRAYIPFSKERELAYRLHSIGVKYFSDEITLKESEDLTSKTLIEFKLKEYDYNISRAAESMGIKRTTLYQKMKNLGIDRKGVEKF